MGAFFYLGSHNAAQQCDKNKNKVYKGKVKQTHTQTYRASLSVFMFADNNIGW